jgi:CDP-diacylglycerol--glycerol-3-phosphate 3-phosphatidyltransferase
MPLNPPNLLSLSRIVFTPVILLLMFSPLAHGTLLAACLFALASLTDIIDGYLARRRSTSSPLGIFLDLIADKVLISALLVILAFQGTLPVWMASLIIGREATVMALRWGAATRGQVMPAAAWGKGKTVVTSMGITAVLLGESLAKDPWAQAANLWGWLNLIASIAYPLMVVATLLTVLSGLFYLRSGLLAIFSPAPTPAPTPPAGGRTSPAEGPSPRNRPQP